MPRRCPLGHLNIPCPIVSCPGGIGRLPPIVVRGSGVIKLHRQRRDFVWARWKAAGCQMQDQKLEKVWEQPGFHGVPSWFRRLSVPKAAYPRTGKRGWWADGGRRAQRCLPTRLAGLKLVRIIPRGCTARRRGSGRHSRWLHRGTIGHRRSWRMRHSLGGQVANQQSGTVNGGSDRGRTGGSS